MTTLYARIRPGSRYASQDPGTPFPVKLKHSPTDGYLWEGQNNQYRYSDLQLLQAWKEGDELQQIPMFAAGEGTEVVEMALGEYRALTDNGQIDARWISRWAADIQGRLDTIVAAAKANDQEEDED